MEEFLEESSNNETVHTLVRNVAQSLPVSNTPHLQSIKLQRDSTGSPQQKSFKQSLSSSKEISPRTLVQNVIKQKKKRLSSFHVPKTGEKLKRNSASYVEQQSSLFTGGQSSAASSFENDSLSLLEASDVLANDADDAEVSFEEKKLEKLRRRQLGKQALAAKLAELRFEIERNDEDVRPEVMEEEEEIQNSSPPRNVSATLEFPPILASTGHLSSTSTEDEEEEENQEPRRPRKRKATQKRQQSHQKDRGACPRIPKHATKDMISHFANMAVHPEASAAIHASQDVFWENLFDTLLAYVDHRGGDTIEMCDIELYMLRTRLAKDKHSINALIEKYLPMEYRAEIIPMATAGNVIIP